MELKRATKKLLSDSNLRLLSNLIISLSNTTTSVQERCVEPYEDGKVYQAGVSLVLKNSELYFCKVTNQDATWNPLHWELIGKDIEEIDVDTVKSWLSLTQDQLDTLSKIILDSEVRLDKCWSSSRVYSSIQDAIDTSKAFTLAEIGKASGASYRVVTSTGDMTEQKYIYLMSDGSGSYNMYIVEDNGTAVQIGSTTISLDEYFTKQEITDNYYDKSTSDGKFATITTVDGKVGKDKILTATSTTATDEQVYSANVVNKSISNQGIYNGNVNEIPMIKPDVLYSYSVRYESCTNLPNLCGHGILENMYLGSIDYATQRLTTINTKTVYMRVKGGGTWGDWIKLSTAEDKMVKVNGDVLEYIKNNPQKNLTIFWDTTDTNTPYTAGFTGSGGGTLISNVFDGKWGSVIGTCGGDFLCINRLMGGTWQGWEKLCTTSVADVPMTTVDLTGTDIHGVVKYTVKSGICYISAWGIESDTAKTAYTLVPAGTMPKPAMFCGTILTHGDTARKGLAMGQLYIDDSQALCLHIYIPNTETIGMGYGSFSYPVAE